MGEEDLKVSSTEQRIAAKQPLFNHIGGSLQCERNRQSQELAVLRLMTRSYVVGVITGKSAGCVPFKILLA